MNNTNEIIVCLHGFLGSKINMFFLVKNLKKHNLHVFNWHYPSRDKNIQQHAQDLAKFINHLHTQYPNRKISFVAHSLGSLVLRSAFNNPLFPKDIKNAHVILLGPPNKGSLAGRKLNKIAFVNYLAKQYSGKELLNNDNFEYLGQFPSDCKVLIIAGKFNPNPFIKKADGLVKIEETYLDTPHDHIIINKSHTGLLFSKKSFSLILNFLQKNS